MSRDKFCRSIGQLPKPLLFIRSNPSRSVQSFHQSLWLARAAVHESLSAILRRTQGDKSLCCAASAVGKDSM